MGIVSEMIDKRGAQDWSRIDASQDWQVQFWATKLQVTKDDIRRAIETVGDTTSDIKKYFGFVGQGRWDKAKTPPAKGGARV